MIVNGDAHAVTSARSTRGAPTWLDSFLFLALMSGPPNFRDRDPYASLRGELDLIALIQIGTWLCGGLWVLARLYPALMRRGFLPALNPAQILGGLFIVTLTFSLWDSPGVLLTAYTLGQFAVMLGFVWVFIHRFGTSEWFRHLFIGVIVLALLTVAALYFAPALVTDEGTGLLTRVRGSNIADTASVALIGTILCLSGVPALRGPMFWGAFSLLGVLLAASRTRSAYIAFLVFLIIGAMFGKRLRIRTLIVPVAVVAASVFVLDATSSATAYLVRETESLETLSDRLPLWQHLTDVVMRDAPITGLGYYAASRIVATEYNPGLGNAHSAFFEVLVGGGILGAAVYLVFCASLVVFAIRLLRVASGQPSAIAAAGLLFADLVMGITTQSALHPGPLGFAFWSLTAVLPALSSEAARARRAGNQQLHA
jgi:O-antigen ligase